jgi:hypothetical protein
MKLVKLSAVVKNENYNLYVQPQDVASLIENADKTSTLKLKDGQVFTLSSSARSAAKLLDTESAE